MPPREQHMLDQIRFMKGQGHKNSDIATAVGLTEAQVRSLCHQNGFRRPASGRIDIPVGAKLLHELQIEARARGERFDAFMRRVLLTIVQDKLFPAILDDGK